MASIFQIDISQKLIQNVPLRTVFANPVTYYKNTKTSYEILHNINMCGLNLNILQQVAKLAEDKHWLLVDLKQSQFVTKQQTEQPNHGQEATST